MVKVRLRLKGFDCAASRLEDLTRKREHRAQYDFVVVRALAKMEKTLELTEAFLKPSGKTILWKGENWRQERDALPAHLKQRFTIDKILEYQFEKHNCGGTLLSVGKTTILNQESL